MSNPLLMLFAPRWGVRMQGFWGFDMPELGAPCAEDFLNFEQYLQYSSKGQLLRLLTPSS